MQIGGALHASSLVTAGRIKRRGRQLRPCHGQGDDGWVKVKDQAPIMETRKNKSGGHSGQVCRANVSTAD